MDELSKVKAHAGTSDVEEVQSWDENVRVRRAPAVLMGAEAEIGCLRRLLTQERDKNGELQHELGFCKSLLQTPEEQRLSEGVIDLQVKYNRAIQAIHQFTKEWDRLPTGSRGQLDIRMAFDDVLRSVESKDCFTCWICKQIKPGKPAYVSKACNGMLFEYCEECWTKRPTRYPH